MDWKNLAAGGAIGGIFLGFLTAGWAKIKSWGWWLASFLIFRVEISDAGTAHIVLAHMINSLKRSRLYDRSYRGNYDYTRDGKYGIIPFEDFSGKTIMFWKGWWPVIYGTTKSAPPQNNSGYYSQEKVSITLTCLRGSVDVEKLIRESCIKRNELCWNVDNDSSHRRFFIRHIPSPDREDKKSGQGFTVGSSMAWYHEGIYRLLNHKPKDLGRSHSGPQKAMNYLIFPDRITRLIQEIHIWRTNRDWYQERGIPWKRGWILYGPPGTGKSALARAFAEDEDMPMFVFSLGEMMNADLIKSWHELQAHVPCIALFEDFDNVFNGRNNVAGHSSRIAEMMEAAMKGGQGSGDSKSPSSSSDGQPHAPGGESYFGGRLSFDCLLNCLDGADKMEGVFTIITTNDISKIDPAIGRPRQSSNGEMEFISTRPGRVDKAIELGYMEYCDKIKMAHRILDEFPNLLEQMLEWLESHKDFPETPAQFQERCSQLALAEFWRLQHEKEGLIGLSVSEGGEILESEKENEAKAA